MTTTLRSIRRRGAINVAGSVFALLAGCSVESLASGDATDVSPTQPPSTVVTPPPASTDSVRIELRFGDELATATLAATPAARDVAAMLPLHLDLRDPMGQAKSGALPGPLDLTGAEPIFNPTVGHVYYWAPSHTIAIFYEDFGHSVPDPGLVRLGAVDIGMDRIARAGNRFSVEIDVLTAPGSEPPDLSE